MKKHLSCLIISFALLLAVPAFLQASPLAFNTERIYGYDQIETAVKIAQKGWMSAQTVMLCESSDFPDAIAATPFASDLNAPILLTGGGAIDARVLEELTRLNPERVILLGGIACLTPAIEQELNDLSLAWERIGGYDRYETSILLAQRLPSDSLILANGDNFPDALSAATFAGIMKIPIVLTSKTVPESVTEYYHEAAPEHLIVVGGEAVVPSEDLTENGFLVETRLAGYDRYETNAEVIAFTIDAYATNDFFIASGVTFPDALTGTVLASKFKTPLLLTEKEDVPPSIYTHMREHMKVEPPTEENKLMGMVTAMGGLNLRETPSVTGGILCIIPRGATVDLSQKEGDWYKITYDKHTGWLSANYITPTPSDNTPVTIDLMENGQVYILGGTGIISAVAQDIMEGKANSKYRENLRAFPPLPSSISRDEDDPPLVRVETLIDPFAGIPFNSLAGKFIMIDPGHGGRDPGTIVNGVSEKTNNLAIALALQEILKQAGANTILTRTTDASVAVPYSSTEDLKARVEMSDIFKPDLYISIHQNYVANPAIQGTETYYYKNNSFSAESKYLAQCIQSSAVGILKTSNRGVKEARFYVLVNTGMPAILFETAFMSNSEDAARLQNPIFQQNVAASIFRGIYNYYQVPLSTNPPVENPLPEDTMDEEPIDEDPLAEEPSTDEEFPEDPSDDPLPEDILSGDPLPHDPLDEDQAGEDPSSDD